MAVHPTIYLTDEEHDWIESNYDTISGGIRELIQADMREGEEADA